jgi:uncharacterized membrane protein (DUF106 family)
MFDLRKKAFLVAVLVLVSLAFVLVPVCGVLGEASASVTHIDSLSQYEGAAATEFNVTLRGTIQTANGTFTISLQDSNDKPVINPSGNPVIFVDNKTAVGDVINEDINFPGLVPGNFKIVLKDNNSTTEYKQSFHVAAQGLAAIPTATFMIILVAIAISFMNMGLNRALITKMIGWHEYRSMQREISEYNSERMAAMRAKDTKALERLKKKESQITSMQTKMFKPQLILLPITFIYLIVWPILTGYFPFTVAYVPGIGAQPFFVWYLVCSFFFGTLASRIIGVTPIQ